MKFDIFIFYKTALYLSVEKGKMEMIEILLTNKNLNVNALNISIYNFLIKLKINFF